MLKKLSSQFYAYGSAVLWVALALLLKGLLEFLLKLEINNFSLIFFPAIWLTTAYSGRGPGLLATLLSVSLSDYALIFSPQNLTIASLELPLSALSSEVPGQWANQLQLALFALEGVAISLLSHRLFAAKHPATSPPQTPTRQPKAGHTANPVTTLNPTCTLDKAQLYQDAQTALQQQAELLAQLDALLTAAPVAIAFLDRELRYVRINQALATLNGPSIEEHLGHRFQDLFPEMATHFAPELQRVIDTGEPVLNIEISGETAGEPKRYGYWLGNYYPVRDPQGQTTGIGVALAEITAIKQADAAAKEANRKVVNILESITDAFFAVDRQWCFTYVNHRCSELLGYSAEQLLGRSIWQAFPESVNTPFYENYQKALAEQTAVHFEVPSGNTGRWFEVRAYPSVDGLSVYVQEITDRKQAENALRESEERLRLALEAGGMSIWDWNLVTGEVRRSEQLKPLYEMAPGSLSRTFADFLEIVHSEDQEFVVQAIQRTVAAGTDYDAEFRIIRADGQMGWIRGKGKALRDETGQTVRVLGVGLDITQRKQQEEALKKSEERLRSIIENMPVMMDAFDADGTLSIWNKECERVTGYSATEMIGNAQALEWLYPDATYRQQMQQQIKEANYQFREWEWNLTCKDGRVKTIAWSNIARKFPIPGWGSWAVGIDVTERRQAEQALRESEERFRVMFDQAAVGIAQASLDGSFILVNPALCEITGYSCEELLQKTFGDITHPEDLEMDWALVRRVLKREIDSYSLEKRYLRKDKSIIWVKLTFSVVWDTQGQPKYALGIVEDINNTKRLEWLRKQAEEALQETNQTLQALIRACPLAITVFSLEDGKVKLWNPAAEEIFGWQEAEVLGELLPTVPLDKQTEFLDNLTVLERGESLAGVEMRRQNKDGRLVDIELWAATLQDAKGQKNCMCIIADISDRKEAEAERERLLQREQAARESAEVANRMKDEFLAVLSHELRSPLNSILGWTQMLRVRQFEPAKVARALEIIERNARLQTQLVEDLLDVSRIIQGKLRLNWRPVLLPQVVEAAIAAVRPAADAKGIEVLSELSFIEPLVWGDSDRLQQVVWNLLSNAIKFTPNGGRVQVRLEQVDESAQIQVSDTGKGIQADFLPYVFERFRQADSTTTRFYGGLGLGLAIVRHLVELHGGTVRAESPGEGQGATFAVRLPLQRGADRGQPGEGGLEGTALSPEANLAGVRVLVVDDEGDSRDFVVAALEDYGAEAIAVASVSQALAELEHWQPDVLVSDVGMPGEDGYALMQKVRALNLPHGVQIPAVAVTAYAREEDVRASLEAGFQRHVAKPVEPAQLVKVVASLVGRGQKRP